MIKFGLQEVEDNILQACQKVGRSRDEITLIAVSKTQPLSIILEGYQEGIRDFGENRVQELVEKVDPLPDDIQWHMIGHLQRNKVKKNKMLCERAVSCKRRYCLQTVLWELGSVSPAQTFMSLPPA